MPRERASRVPRRRLAPRAGARLRVPAVLVQFVKFGIVGVSNTLLTFAVYTLLLKVFGVWYIAASAIGFIVGRHERLSAEPALDVRGHVGDALTPVRWAVVQTAGLGAEPRRCSTCSSTTPGSTSSSRRRSRRSW